MIHHFKALTCSGFSICAFIVEIDCAPIIKLPGYIQLPFFSKIMVHLCFIASGLLKLEITFLPILGLIYKHIYLITANLLDTFHSVRQHKTRKHDQVPCDSFTHIPTLKHHHQPYTLYQLNNSCFW